MNQSLSTMLIPSRFIAVPIVAIVVALGAQAHAGMATQGASYQGASYQGASYQGASYQGASYQGASYQGASYQGASYQGASYQGASYQGASYQGASYQGASYQGASYQGPRTRDGWLEGERLIGAIVDLSTARFDWVAITDLAGDLMQGTRRSVGSSRTDRTELLPGDLIGLHWVSWICPSDTECANITYRVTGTRRDTTSNTMVAYSDNSDVWLYDVEYSVNGDSDTWAPVCPDGSGALFVNGRWNADGSWNPAGYTISCQRGVIAKCIRSWGYKPWKALPSPEHGSIDLGDLHRACVRAARADYCGDGHSHTRDGTLVDISDRYGFNVPEAIPGFRDESVFGIDGALSVNAPRWPTATRDADDWVFPTCRRSPQMSPERRSEALLTVKSVTVLGRAATR